MAKKRLEVDLLAIIILTLVFLFIIFAGNISWLRTVLGFTILILFPGYLFIGALYPRKDSLSQVNRMALSLGLSIVIVVLTGLMLNYTPWGIGLYSIIISISILILILSAITWYIRGRYHPGERYDISFKSPGWHVIAGIRTGNRVYLGVIAAVILAVVTGTGVLGYMLARPVESQPFTEFYILGSDNRADNYPLELELGEEGTVLVGIVNHEDEVVNYRIEVVVEENKSYELFPIELKPEEIWHRELKFTPEMAVKRQKVEFRLASDKSLSDEIRYIWVDVKA